MIALATPYNPGDLDPGQTYANVMIHHFTAFPSGREMHLHCVYGNGTSSADFVQGKAPAVDVVVRDGPNSPDFSTMCATCTPEDASELLYTGVSRSLSEWLIANVPVFAGGTVV